MAEAQLSERDKSIVGLIDKLAELASDEVTTKDTIDNIMSTIKTKTRENIRAEMDEAKNPPPKTKMEFPGGELTNDIRSSVMQELERTTKDVELPIQREPLVFTRVREVKSPTKAHPTDAGIDFFVPDKKAWNDDFKETVKKYSKNVEVLNPDGTTFDGLKFEDDALVVSPNTHVAIPSGIKTIIPQGLAMMMVNKSGVATKLKLDHSACLIDSEYRDELVFCFFNHNVDSVKIEPGMKITQGLIVPVIDLELQEVLNCVYDDITKSSGDRGGGFGSSGTH